MYKVTLTAKVSGPLFEPGKPREIIKENLLSALWEAVLYITEKVRELTPIGVFGDAGLKGSIFGEVREEGGLFDLMGIVSSPLEYAEPVELGTDPHMPPVAPLVRWSEVVLGLSGPAAVSAAWAVAKSISRRGTTGKFMFARGLATSTPKLQEIFEAAGFDIIVELS